MPFGDNIASAADLEYLCSNVSKDEHLLRETDVTLADKMNYPAVERLCRPDIRRLLHKHVPGITTVILRKEKN